MNIGSVNHSPLSQAAQQSQAQAATQQAATKQTEEQSESSQQRVKEAGKGENIDTHA